jgi:hypothetical protein
MTLTVQHREAAAAAAAPLRVMVAATAAWVIGRADQPGRRRAQAALRAVKVAPNGFVEESMHVRRWHSTARARTNGRRRENENYSWN